jgi:DNA-binding MarR family transcriptional regulator
MTIDSSLVQNLVLVSRATQLVLEEEVLKALNEPNITAAKANILRLLGRQRRQTVKDLAVFLGQTKAAASQNVESLVRAKLVSRVGDKVDRRCVWVSLTSRGRRFLQRAESQQLEVLRQVKAHYSEKALIKLVERMRSLAFTLLAHSNTKTESCLGCCAFNSAGCLHGPEGWQCAYTKSAVGPAEAPRASVAP